MSIICLSISLTTYIHISGDWQCMMAVFFWMDGRSADAVTAGFLLLLPAFLLVVVALGILKVFGAFFFMIIIFVSFVLALH